MAGLLARHGSPSDGDGLVHAPTGPGLGARIDFELIEHNEVAVLR